MRIEDVQTFLRIVATKTLGNTAIETHLTQSTVSKRLQRLEEDVGAKLIERHKGVRSVTLTRAGQTFVGIANRWLEIQSDVRMLHAANEQLQLCVGSLESQNLAFFSLLYSALLRHRPVLRLRIMQRHSDVMYALVEKRVIDVGFAPLELHNSYVKVRPCYRDPMVGLRLARNTRTVRLTEAETVEEPVVRVTDLDPEQELYMEWSTSLRDWHEQHWDRTTPGRVRIDSISIIQNLLQEPEQWTILPYSLAKACAERGDLEIFRIKPAPPERICYALTHKFPTEETVAALRIIDAILTDLLPKKLPAGCTIYENFIL
jgi:DNA-binding transcriptional LysR family regulator